VTVSRNNSLSPRTGTIVLRQVGGTHTDVVEVTQAGTVPSLTVIPSSTSIKGTGDLNLTLTVSANFKVVCSGSDRGWAVKTDSLGVLGSGSRSYKFVVAPTDLSIPREARVTFKSMDGEVPFTQTYTITQQGATVMPADSSILVMLYNALSGIVWRDRWILSTPVSGWSGITLSTIITNKGERRVEGISLSGVGLFGKLENGIVVKRVPLEDLDGLRKLDLSNNLGLGGELPVNLYKIKQLRELDLSRCTFVNAEDGSGRNIPAEWGGMHPDGGRCFSDLSMLRLYSNSLSGEVPLAVYKHPNWNDYWNPTAYILPQRYPGVNLTTPP